MNENNVLNKSVINWYPGHMAKTKKLISKNYELIDVVYELIDARIPYSSKIKDISNIIGKKPKILIMTKKDLCDMKYTQNWIKYYENLGSKVLLVDLNDNKDYQKIINLTIELTKDIQQKRKEKGLKPKDIHVLVIGIPNVGKSTLINKLCGKKSAQTGNMPGVTKQVTWLKAQNNILLLDTPGLLWPKLDIEEVALNLAAFTAIREEVLPIDDVAVHILTKLQKYYPNLLLDKYGLADITDIEESYNIIGKKIGAIKNGECDYNRVSLKIINDIKNESLKNITFDN